MTQAVEDQTPAAGTCRSCTDNALLRRESANAAKPVERWTRSNSVEESREDEEQESAACPTEAMQVGGSALAAPDGGWGWVVLAATMLVLCLTLAFPSCIGIFYTDLQNEFNASNTQTSWVPAILNAMLYAGGRVILPLHTSRYPL